jgi:hypothetical protein
MDMHRKTDGPWRYTFADVHLVSDVPLPDLQPASGNHAPLHVNWADHLPPVAPEWYHRWGDEQEEWARFGATAEGWVVVFPALAEFRIPLAADAVIVCPGPDVPAHTVVHLLLNQVLPLVLSRSGRLVLHAGAVAIDGRIVAFVGPTGSGKSTLVAACARAGAEVVCDDSLVVYRQGAQWVGVPSYPALRLWQSSLDRVGWAGEGQPAAHYTNKRRVGTATGQWRFADGARAFSRVILLEHDTPVRPVAVELFSQVFRLDIRDQEEAVRLFHLVGDLAVDLQITRLGPRESRDAVAIADALCLRA